jgi:type IV pilus assembly protein PilB
VQSRALNPEDEKSKTLTTSAAAYVDALFAQALQQRASDLHLEPQKTGLQIRLRVDGLLHDLPSPSADIAQRLCARIKILAKLDIAERRLPQDGRISVICRGQQLDLRVSSLPTLWGEKLVLRIVLQESSILPLSDLGLNENQFHDLSNALAQPQGLILVTGPTGSGKTLTLYSALQTLNQRHINISTAEEPVEIPLPGINQVGIKTQIGLDFSNSLRALLRQDPDVLMVGEIRDPDTASMAIRAAQTGHLVLSTVHTKSASATLGRMRQLGISDRDLQESVTLVVAQRLLRRLCDQCKIPRPQTGQHCLNRRCPSLSSQFSRLRRLFEGISGTTGDF